MDELKWGECRIGSVRQVGAGGLGVVDEVVVTETYGGYPVGTRFARKRLNAQFAKDANHRARFEREIEQMRSLSHDRIVPYRGENVGGERFYLMPIYPQSLRDWLGTNPSRVPWRDAASYCAEIADAMAYAHANNVYHRDLKPENILLDSDRRPHVADWGLGQFIHKHSKVLDLTRAGLGTQWYCSVEQWANGAGDHRSDIYSLGMMLAELVLGARFELKAPGMGVTFDLIDVRSDAEAATFNAAVRAMTAVSAGRRYQSMAEVAQALRFACVSIDGLLGAAR